MAVNEELTGFIREALNRGLPRDEIRGALGQADWSDEEVQAALRSFATVDFPIASLEVLGADPRVHVSTVDPGSAEPYEYRPLDEDTYELCASFDGESPAPRRRTPAGFWSHGVGRQCFELSVVVSGRGADR